MKVSATYKYNWLLDVLKSSNGMSMAELKKKYRTTQIYEDTHCELSERSFYNMRKDLREHYDITVYLDRTGHQYKYRLAQKDARISEWLSDTMAVQQTISEHRTIKDRILIERVPNSNHLAHILDAIKENTCITFTFTDYWEDPIQVTIKPLFVKMFRQRWHVVGPVYDPNRPDKPRRHMTPEELDSIRSYGMDERMTDLKKTDIEFNYPKDLDPNEFFYNNFSTIKFPEKHMRTEKIRILAWQPQDFYLKSVPMHHSQKTLYTSETDGYTIFEYWLQPTLDFEMELRSHGDYVEVLSPLWFRKEMREEAQKVVNAYGGHDRATLKEPIPKEYAPDNI